MSERAKQNLLSLVITVAGVALLLFSRHKALTHGEYSLKLVIVGGALLVFGPASFVLNLKDPMTVRRALDRLTSQAPGNKPSVKGTLAVLVLLLVLTAVIDYLFNAWISSELSRCQAAQACDQSPRSVP